MKKVLSLILILCLCLSIFPATALAADEDFVIVNGVLTKYNGPGGDVVIPDGVTSIECGFYNDSLVYSPFINCSKLTSVTIPEGVTRIGEYTFYGCSNLTSVTLPDTVTYIDERAFMGCSSLTNINIPNGVTSIGAQAFDGCTALASAKVPSAAGTSGGLDAFPSTTKITLVGHYFDIQDGVLEEYRGPGGDVVIPNGVTKIAYNTFYNCYDLTSVTIPMGVTEIGRNAFGGCSGLTSVTIPSSVTRIGDTAFHSCTSLTSITIPDGVTEIGNYAFSDCTSLTSITIPGSVTTIGEYAFDGCRSLTSVTMLDGVTEIGTNAFRFCEGLISATIPGSVTKISEFGAPFEFCTSLARVTVLPGVKEISLNLPNLKSISLPDSVEKLSISSKALRELVIPAGATEWPQLNCPRLGKLTFPKDNWVFKGISRATFMDKIKSCPSLNEIVNCPNEFVPDLIAANKTLRDNWTDPKSTIVPQSARITKLSNEITAGLTTQYDKAKAISQWVVDHIKYDYDYYYEGLKDYSDVPFDPEEILDKGQAVCAGFARLTQALLVVQGIPCLYVRGMAKEHHAWNLAYIDGEYLWIDNTWGMKYFGLGIYAISRDHTATGAATFNNVKDPGTLVQGSSEADGMTEAAEETTADNAPVLPAATGMAYASTQMVEVDGKKVEFQYYALRDENGDPTNYIKLRDLAFALNGTPAQFQVAWDGAAKSITLTSGTAYTPVGSENSTPYSGNQIYAVSAAKLIINGKAMNLAAFTLDNGGYTYFQLRELGQNLGFNVGWSRARGVFVETDKPYDPND